MPDHLELSPRQVVALYTALRLWGNGLHATPINPAQSLNRQTGRRYTARRWADILAPYYRAITSP